MQVGLVYSHEELKIGQFRYSAQLIKHMAELVGEDLNKHPLKKKEYELFGRPVAGYITLWAQKLFSHFDDEVIHALDHVCAPKNADVATVHDLIPFKYPELYMDSIHYKIGHRFNRWFAKKIPYFIVQTEHVKNDLVEMWGIEEERIFKTPPGLSHDIFYPSENVPDCMDCEKDVLLFVGDDNPRKNLPLVLKALRGLDDVRLVWVGGSKWGEVRAECDRIIEENGLDVVRPGFVPDEELRDYYSNADLFVYPSRDEGTGYTPIEAMACGTTSVVSDIPVFHEVLGDMVYYSDMDPGVLAEKIEEALADPFKEEKLVGRAEDFRWEKTAEATLDVYEKIMDI